MASGLLLGIRLGFHHHTPKQAAVLLAFHQQATNQVGGDQLGGAGEEGLGKGWEILGDGLGGYGSGFGDGAFLDWSKADDAAWASPSGVALGSQQPSQQ